MKNIGNHQVKTPIIHLKPLIFQAFLQIDENFVETRSNKSYSVIYKELCSVLNCPINKSVNHA